MFERCLSDAAFEQAVGMAIECHRLDVIKDAVTRAAAGDTRASQERAEALLRYSFDLS